MNDEVTLRPFVQEAAAALAVLANNPNVVAQVRDNFPHPYTIADARFWIDYCKDSQADGNYHQAIYFGDAFAGGIGMMRQPDIHRNSAEIGYWLGEPYWGRNIMTRAVLLLTEWIFANTTIHRLYAGVFETNAASMRVLEKAGYHLEAIHKKAITKNGQIFDEHLYVRLA